MDELRSRLVALHVLVATRSAFDEVHSARADVRVRFAEIVAAHPEAPRLSTTPPSLRTWLAKDASDPDDLLGGCFSFTEIAETIAALKEACSAVAAESEPPMPPPRAAPAAVCAPPVDDGNTSAAAERVSELRCAEHARVETLLERARASVERNQRVCAEVEVMNLARGSASLARCGSALAVLQRAECTDAAPPSSAPAASAPSPSRAVAHKPPLPPCAPPPHPRTLLTVATATPPASLRVADDGVATAEFVFTADAATPAAASSSSLLSRFPAKTPRSQFISEAHAAATPMMSDIEAIAALDTQTLGAVKGLDSESLSMLAKQRNTAAAVELAKLRAGKEASSKAAKASKVESGAEEKRARLAALKEMQAMLRRKAAVAKPRRRGKKKAPKGAGAIAAPSPATQRRRHSAVADAQRLARERVRSSVHADKVVKQRRAEKEKAKFESRYVFDRRPIGRLRCSTRNASAAVPRSAPHTPYAYAPAAAPLLVAFAALRSATLDSPRLSARRCSRRDRSSATSSRAKIRRGAATRPADREALRTPVQRAGSGAGRACLSRSLRPGLTRRIRSQSRCGSFASSNARAGRRSTHRAPRRRAEESGASSPSSGQASRSRLRRRRRRRRASSTQRSVATTPPSPRRCAQVSFFYLPLHFTRILLTV